jgi:GMP synthase (glutamine-hydrolysing)
MIDSPLTSSDAPPVWVLRHVPHEGLGTIADSLARCGIPSITIDVLAGPLPQFDPQKISGLIVMGGPMNVDQTDRYPNLVEEVRWLRQAVDANLPVLGVCLGSQLLAKALGRRVYANRIKEIGWYEIELLPTATTDPLFKNLSLPSGEGRGEGATLPSPDFVGGDSRRRSSADASRITVFQWHGDTFDLPAGAVQLARSPHCENQAFRYGDRAFGLQFHMEVTAEIIADWLGQSDNCGELAELDYIDPATIRRETPEKLPNMIALGRQVFDNFAQLCHR